MKLPPLVALRAFEAVSRHKSIRQAATELNVDPSAVSRHLQTLQSLLKVKLLTPSRRGISLTDEGLRYAAEIGPAFSAIAQATARLAPAHGALSLSIWTVPGFALHWLTPHLREFRELHPAIEVVIRPTEEPPDLARGEADVAIGYGAARWEGCKHISIAKPRVYPVASPRWLEKEKNIPDIATLLTCPLIHEESYEHWHEWFSACGIEVKERLSGPRLWHAHLALEAAKRGQGIALANDFIASEDISLGGLVEIGQTNVILGPYTLAARADRWGEATISRFRAWILSALHQ